MSLFKANLEAKKSVRTGIGTAKVEVMLSNSLFTVVFGPLLASIVTLSTLSSWGANLPKATSHCGGLLSIDFRSNIKRGYDYEIFEEGTDPEGSGGKFYHSRFILGQRPTHPAETYPELLTFIKMYPKLTGDLGFYLDIQGSLIYPDAAALNFRIERLKGTTNEAFVRWYNDPGKTDAISFAHRWVENGEVPIAEPKPGSDLDLHTHDLRSHGPGYLLLPREIVLHHRKQINFLLALTKDAVLVKNKKFQDYVKQLIGKKILDLDEVTAEIGGVIYSLAGKDKHLEDLPLSDEASKRFIAALKKLSRTQPHLYNYKEAFPFDHWSSNSVRGLGTILTNLESSVGIKSTNKQKIPYSLKRNEQAQILAIAKSFEEVRVNLNTVYEGILNRLKKLSN